LQIEDVIPPVADELDPMVRYLRFLGDEEGALKLNDIAAGNGHLISGRSPVDVRDMCFGKVLSRLPTQGVEDLTGVGHGASSSLGDKKLFLAYIRPKIYSKQLSITMNR
jgi:hypothetical protein